jgi:hypothetical protein
MLIVSPLVTPGAYALPVRIVRLDLTSFERILAQIAAARHQGRNVYDPSFQPI